MCKMKVTGVSGTSEVQKTDDKMSATLVKRGDTSKDGITFTPEKSSVKTIGVSGKSQEALDQDKSKIESGTVSTAKWQKAGNAFINIARWFEGKPPLPWKVWDAGEDKAFTEARTKNINEALGTKTQVFTQNEFKMIEGYLDGGKDKLNEALSKVGLDPKLLEKSDGGISITTFQKEALKKILTGIEPLSPEQGTLTSKTTEIIGNYDKILKVPDRNDISKRYSLNDMVFNPEVSGEFKKHLAKEFSTENMNFVQDLKIALKNPDKESLKAIYDHYVKDGSDEMINVSYKNRKNATDVFEKKDNPTLDEMLTALQPAAKDIIRLVSDSYSRFTKDEEVHIPDTDKIEKTGITGISRAIHADAMLLPPGKAREEYIQKLIDRGNAPDASEHEKFIASHAKGALILEQQIILKNLEDAGMI